MKSSLKALALYVHVPFCIAKCTYCDFYSVIGQEDSIPEYITLIRKEIAHKVSSLDLSKHFIDTIFFGGGTPNLLAPNFFEQVLKDLLEMCSLGTNLEIGMEINPGEVNYESLKAYRDIGVNRISIGMQSFQPHLLQFMSRIHTADQSLSTYEAVRQAGFENVSADLIFAIPGQTMDHWMADLHKLTKLNPEHISTYSLTVEAGTALKRWVDAGHVEMLEDTIDTGMYSWGRDFIESLEYQNYEISNYAKKGFVCRHNLNYWSGSEYLGFGPSAHSYFKDRRHWNIGNLDLYMKSIRQHGHGEEDAEHIDEQTAKNEMILTRLRLSQGLDLIEYSTRFGEHLLSKKAEAVNKWQDQISITQEFLSINREGWSLVDEISSDFMNIS